MLWSFYTCVHELATSHVTNLLPGTDRTQLKKVADIWCRWVSAAFLRSYFDAAHVLPLSHPVGVHRIHDAALLLDCFCLSHGLEKLESDILNTKKIDETIISGMHFWLDSAVSITSRVKT
jgi:hypothetical protein